VPAPHPRLFRRRTLAAAALLCVPLALAACGGGATQSAATPNGVQALTAQQILARSTAAAKGASSVHVTGSEGGTRLDLRVGHDVATGTVSQGGLTAQVLRVGGTTYLKGDAAFWDATAGAGTGESLAGRWVVADTSSQDTSGMASFTDIGRLVDLVLAPTGTLSKTSVTTVDGQQVVGVVDSSDSSTLYVALTGPPYPVTIQTPGATDPPTFSDWNQPIPLETPPPDQVVTPGP
jgi:hypothetical protein